MSLFWIVIIYLFIAICAYIILRDDFKAKPPFVYALFCIGWFPVMIYAVGLTLVIKRRSKKH